MQTAIVNAHIISPDLDIPGGTILVDGSVISAVLPPEEPLPEVGKIVDLAGKMIAPGFIDIHCHGRDGYDFCDGSNEAITQIARGKLSEGVTSFLGTTLTVSEEQLTAALQNAANYMARQHDGAKMPGIHLEGPFINPDCLGAQNPAHASLPDIGLVNRLNDIYPIRKLSYSIELPGGDELARALLAMGITPSCAHSAAKYADFKRLYELGLRDITHFCNVVTPLHHLEFGVVGGGMLHKDVFVELICDGRHLCPEMIKLLFDVKGCDHIILITDAIRATNMPDGEYDLGGIIATVRDGCARTPAGRMAGSTLEYYQGLRRVVDTTGLPLSELIKTTSWNQAKSLGLENLGKIEPGFTADLVVLNKDFSPAAVWVNGLVAKGE